MALEKRTRTGWISFVAVLGGIAGLYHLVSGIAAITSDRTVKHQAAEVIYNINISAWGWVWVFLGIFQLVTAFLIWKRTMAGFILGLIWAALGAAFTVIVIFSYPLWAIVMITLDVASLFGLLQNVDEFGDE